MAKKNRRVPHMRLANFNIRATPRMRARRVRQDLRVARATDARVINWQELGKYASYKKILHEVFAPRNGWVHLHLDTPTIQSVNTNHFKVLRHFSVKLTKGDRRLPQPPRYTNVVVVEDKHTGLVIAVLDSHFANGKYKRLLPKWNRKARARLWDTQFYGTCDIVHELHDEGLHVTGSGDYNDRDFPKFHPDQVDVVKADVTKIWYVPAPNRQLYAKDVITIKNLWTDHHGTATTLHR